MNNKQEWNKQIWENINIVERERNINNTEKRIFVTYLKMQLHNGGNLKEQEKNNDIENK